MANENPESVVPFQFTLMDIMLTFVLVASSFGLFGGEGIIASAVLIYVIVRRRLGGGAKEIGCFLTLAFVFLSLCLLPPVNAQREPGRRTQCARNLEELGRALQAYRKEHGHFPPAVVTDSRGKPMHSWRALILPYLGRKDLYDQYNFKEPWDSADNRKVADKRPDVVACATNRIFDDKSTNGTNYVAVTGPGSAWAKNEATQEGTFDGARNTILLVETRESGIDWLQPRDISVEEGAASIDCLHKGQEPHPHIGSCHFSGVHALFADGSVRFLPGDLPKPTLKALLATDVGGQIDIDSLGLPRLNTGPVWRMPEWHSPWSGPVAFVVLLATVYLLLRRRQPPSRP